METSREQTLTVICAISENGKVWMGGDSAGVGGLSLSVRKDPKVFINGDFIIGYTTSFRMGQLLQYSLHPPEMVKGEDGMAYMVRRFIPAVKDCLKGGGFQSTQNSVDEGGVFLVGFHGELYEIQSDYQVSRVVQQYDACGCGYQIALGSLHTTDGYQLSPKERLMMALNAAEAFSAGVRGPFYVLVK